MAFEDLDPVTRLESILAGRDLDPITRAEYFLKIAANEVPKPESSEDAGKVVTVNEDGDGFVLTEPAAGSDVPDPTTGNAGDVIAVSSNSDYELITPNFLPDAIPLNKNKILGLDSAGASYVFKRYPAGGIPDFNSSTNLRNSLQVGDDGNLLWQQIGYFNYFYDDGGYIQCSGNYQDIENALEGGRPTYFRHHLVDAYSSNVRVDINSYTYSVDFIIPGTNSMYVDTYFIDENGTNTYTRKTVNFDA